jgi:hypothetical protein
MMLVIGILFETTMEKGKPEDFYKNILIKLLFYENIPMPSLLCRGV